MKALVQKNIPFLLLVVAVLALAGVGFAYARPATVNRAPVSSGEGGALVLLAAGGDGEPVQLEEGGVSVTVGLRLDLAGPGGKNPIPWEEALELAGLAGQADTLWDDWPRESRVFSRQIRRGLEGYRPPYEKEGFFCWYAIGGEELFLFVELEGQGAPAVLALWCDMQTLTLEKAVLLENRQPRQLRVRGGEIYLLSGYSDGGEPAGLNAFYEVTAFERDTLAARTIARGRLGDTEEGRELSGFSVGAGERFSFRWGDELVELSPEGEVEEPALAGSWSLAGQEEAGSRLILLEDGRAVYERGHGSEGLHNLAGRWSLSGRTLNLCWDEQYISQGGEPAGQDTCVYLSPTINQELPLQLSYDLGREGSPALWFGGQWCPKVAQPGREQEVLHYLDWVKYPAGVFEKTWQVTLVGADGVTGPAQIGLGAGSFLGWQATESLFNYLELRQDQLAPGTPATLEAELAVVDEVTLNGILWEEEGGYWFAPDEQALGRLPVPEALYGTVNLEKIPARLTEPLQKALGEQGGRWKTAETGAQRLWYRAENGGRAEVELLLDVAAELADRE